METLSVKPLKTLRLELPAPVLSSHVDEWIIEWASAWSVLDLPSMVRVGFSKRFTRALGRCTPKTGSIRLNRKLTKANHEILREVLCHEVAHVAVWHAHGRSARPHGPEWRELMALAGYEPRVKWVRKPDDLSVGRPGRKFTIYDHVCPVCGSSWSAKRRVSTWRCGACLDAGLEGRLEIYSRPTGRIAQR
jgi:predicted SprT family Zn-dependent metalloprotease